MNFSRLQSRFRSRHWRTLHLIVLALALLLIFFGGWIIERRVETMVAQRVQAKLTRLQISTGIPIKVRAIDVQFGSVRLVDISVGEGQPIIVDHVDIGLSFNPFSPAFLRPGKVDVGRVLVKEYVERDRRWEWLRTLVDQFRVSKSGVREESSRSMLLPAEIVVHAGQILLASDKDEHTAVEGLRMSLFLPEKKVVWRASEVTVKPYLHEQYIEGRINYQDRKKPKILVRSRPNFEGKPRWSADCHYLRDMKLARCELEASKIPDSLSTPVQRYLGSSFAPGASGVLEAAKVADKGWRLSFDGDILGAIVEHKALSIQALGPFDIGAQFSVLVDPKRKTASSHDMKVALPVVASPGKSVAMNISFDVAQSILDDKRVWDGEVHASLEKASCDAVLKAIPKGFAADLDGISLSGQMSAEVSLRVSKDRADFKWGKVDIGCETKKLPEIYTREYLSGSFMLERSFENGRVVRIPVDEKGAHFAGLKDIPAHVINAFITSEDAGFWQHSGVEPAAIEQALERNAREGRAAVGGSTITMQTVKNLFLARDKTLSRKAQEIFLAWHLERTIGKKRILEIYLNIVEFGPELYGIGAAAKRFFGISPHELSLKQAVYLASLLPAPIPRYQYFCRGELTDNYKSLVSTLLGRMLALGRISATDLATASAEGIKFEPSSGDEECDRRALVRNTQDSTSATDDSQDEARP